MARVGLRHGLANSVEQIAHGEAVPIREECAARERRRGFATGKHVAVASRAFLVVDRLAALGLLFGVYAVPDGTRLRCWGLRAKQAKRRSDRCQNEDGRRIFMPLRIDEFLTTSGVSPCAICQTNSPWSRLMAVIVPYGGLTSGNPSTSMRLKPPPAGFFGGLGESAPAFSPGPWRISTSLPAVPAM